MVSVVLSSCKNGLYVFWYLKVALFLCDHNSPRQNNASTPSFTVSCSSQSTSTHLLLLIKDNDFNLTMHKGIFFRIFVAE